MVVVSENGSRLSLPSTARAPFTVTGTSSATGCALLLSVPLAEVSEARSGFSDGMGRLVLSFSVGGMSYSFAEKFRLSSTGAELSSNLFIVRGMRVHEL